MKLLHKKLGGHKKTIVAAAFLFLMGSAFCQNTLPFTKGVNLLRWFETWNNSLPPLNKYDEADFATLKSMGVDIIRLPIHFEFVMDAFLF